MVNIPLYLKFEADFESYEINRPLRGQHISNCTVYIYINEDRIVRLDKYGKTYYPRPATREEFV
jgi:hypothetical protein